MRHQMDAFGFLVLGPNAADTLRIRIRESSMCWPTIRGVAVSRMGFGASPHLLIRR